MRVRYAPTISLAVPDRRGIKPLARTAVVVGHLFPRDADEVAEREYEALRTGLPGAARLPRPAPGSPATFASVVDRLVVLDDIDGSGSGGPYDWSPIPAEKGQGGGALSAWLNLPWNAPDQIVLPGFHTAAENGLKRGGNGSEVFLTTCALLANGTRSALVSRWRTGGKNAYELVREFVQELPHGSAAEAWQRSVLLSMNRELDPRQEPRLRMSAPDEPLKADHPFFWSGYLLVDTGAGPAAEAAPPAAGN
jgi:hypothetical protein